MKLRIKAKELSAVAKNWYYFPNANAGPRDALYNSIRNFALATRCSSLSLTFFSFFLKLLDMTRFGQKYFSKLTKH